MLWSDLMYVLALGFYMQAMPLKLVAYSVVVNVVVLGIKLYWRI